MTSANQIMEALLVVIISLALLPVVRDFVADAVNGSSATEATLLGLITLFWVLATVAIVASMTGFKFGRR